MSSTQTGKEAAVSAAVEALRKAMIAGDRSALDKPGLRPQGLVYFGPFPATL